MKNLVLLISIVSLAALTASAQTKIAVKDIAKYKGKSVMVCENVVSTEHVWGTNTTTLNLSGGRPNQLLAVVVKGDNSNEFKQPELYFKGRSVCVTGKIVDNDGKLELVVNDPSQVKLYLIDSRMMMRQVSNRE